MYIFNEVIYQAAPLVIPSGKISVVHGFFGDLIFLCGYEYDSANCLKYMLNIKIQKRKQEFTEIMNHPVMVNTFEDDCLYHHRDNWQQDHHYVNSQIRQMDFA
jgi:hypothetical protein